MSVSQMELGDSRLAKLSHAPSLAIRTFYALISHRNECNVNYMVTCVFEFESFFPTESTKYGRWMHSQ